jgi:hypothetical protein
VGVNDLSTSVGDDELVSATAKLNDWPTAKATLHGVYLALYWRRECMYQQVWMTAEAINDGEEGI